MSDTELTDDAFEAMINDPALITTHAQTLEILDSIGAEIASITSQIDSFAIANAGRDLTEAQSGWLHRATMARGFRQNELRRVLTRDREIRVINMNAPKKDRSEEQAKHERFMAEVETRRAKADADRLRAQAAVSKIALQRNLGKLFMDVAKERLDIEMFEALLTETRRRRSAVDTVAVDVENV